MDGIEADGSVAWKPPEDRTKPPDDLWKLEVSSSKGRIKVIARRNGGYNWGDNKKQRTFKPRQVARIHQHVVRTQMWCSQQNLKVGAAKEIARSYEVDG